MNLVVLAVGFMRRTGRARALITGACTAVVSGLLLVAVAVVQFDGARTSVVANADGTPMGIQSGVSENVANLLADGGVRPGYVLALVLICLVPLTLLQQAVRLGTASRERRLAGLRLAGATSRQVRALAAVEVGLPAGVGALLGWPVYLLLRGLFGGSGAGRWSSDTDVVRELRMVPISVAPSWWQVLLVVSVVFLAGIAAGALASRAVVVSPLGLSRGASASPPRPWLSLGLLGAGAVLTLGIYPTYFDEWFGTASALAGVACAVVGILLIAPWVAHQAGRIVARRATTPALLIAARRLAAEPRPAGRAAAATGAIALVAGGAITLVADLASGDGNREAMYIVPTALVFGLLVAALVVTTITLAVHSVESMTDRKRSLAALVATGVPLAVLERAQQWEAALVSVPVSVAGVAVTGLGTGPFLAPSPAAMLIRIVLVTCVLGLTWLALIASTRAVRPWLHRAVNPENLRTA